MEQVSKILENIIAVEYPADDPAAKTDDVEPAKHIHNAEQQAEDPRPELARHYSAFWYLEDDQKKISNQLTDKLVEKVLGVILNGQGEVSGTLDGRMTVHSTRPPLSVNLMSTNTTQLAQKGSPVFEVMDTVAMVLGWHNPYFSVGACLLATHVILNPYLITTLPSLYVLKKFLLPSYLKLYPPDRSIIDNQFTFHNPVPHEGPPLGKQEPPKPISQFSREFIMNFTDMQNQIVPYIRMYDALVSWGQHYFLFENPRLSSVVFLLLLVTTVGNLVLLPRVVPFILSHFPIKAFAIASVWMWVGAFHPAIKERALDYVNTEEARLARLDSTDRAENFFMKFMVDEDDAQQQQRQVEIFELQRLSSRNIWKQLGFSTDHYALNHPERLIDEADVHHDTHSSHSHQGSDDTQSTLDSFEDEQDKSMVASSAEMPGSSIATKETLLEVKAPKDWVFAEPKWLVDLDPQEWVAEECLMDLVNIDTDEKWVYDYTDGEHYEGSIYRRRRWVRMCKRAAVTTKAAALPKKVVSSA